VKRIEEVVQYLEERMRILQAREEEYKRKGRFDDAGDVRVQFYELFRLHRFIKEGEDT